MEAEYCSKCGTKLVKPKKEEVMSDDLDTEEGASEEHTDTQAGEIVEDDRIKEESETVQETKETVTVVEEDLTVQTDMAVKEKEI